VPNPSPKIEDSLAMYNRVIPGCPMAQDFAALLKYAFDRLDLDDEPVAKRYCGLYRAFAKTLWAAATPHDRWLVIDGGLIHRGKSFDNLGAAVPLRRYFETMPLPDLVVAVTADMDTVVRRNVERGGSHDRSDDMERSFEVHELGMSIIKDRNAAVLEIDTTATGPENNALTILEAMKAA
jgi:hypothetical protein